MCDYFEWPVTELGKTKAAVVLRKTKNEIAINVVLEKATENAKKGQNK